MNQPKPSSEGDEQTSKSVSKSWLTIARGEEGIAIRSVGRVDFFLVHTKALDAYLKHSINPISIRT